MEVVAPIQEGANRALKPFRDLFGWFGDTLDAKEERDELEAERDALRQQVAAPAGGRERERRAARHGRLRPRQRPRRLRAGHRARLQPLELLLVLDDRDQQGLQRRRRGQPAGHQRQGPRRQGQDGLGRQRGRDAAHRLRVRRLGAGRRRPTSPARSCRSPARPATCCSTSCPRRKEVRTGDTDRHRRHGLRRGCRRRSRGHPDRHASSAIEGEGELDRTIHVDAGRRPAQPRLRAGPDQAGRRPARLDRRRRDLERRRRRPPRRHRRSSAGSCS